MHFALLDTKCKTEAKLFLTKKVSSPQSLTSKKKKKTYTQGKPTGRHNHNHAGIKKNMYLSATVEHCIHVLLHNLDRGVWRDLIIAHKATLLEAGINYRFF